MGFWNWLGRFTQVPEHQFDADEAVRPIDRVIMQMHASSGRSVTRVEALSVPVVLRGRNILTAPAALPLVQRGPGNRIERSPLLGQIDPNVANVVTMATTLEDLVFEGVAWWRVLSRDAAGYPLTARRVDPATVSPTPPPGAGGSTFPSGITSTPVSELYIDGERVPFRDVIAFHSPNPAVLKVAGRAIRRVLDLDDTASLYATNPRPLDYFDESADGGADMEDDEKREFLEDWAAARRTRSTAFIPSGINYNTVDVPSPADLQLVELARKASLDIANAFGIDPEDLGVSTTSRTYQNAVDRRRDRINDVHLPYMRAITDRLSMGDVTRRGHAVEFDLDEYLRANPTERWANHKTAVEIKAKTVDEVRIEERMQPLPPGALAPDLPQAGRPALRSVPAAADPAAVGFDATSSSHVLTFAAPEVTQTFAADAERRTITGVAVPYGAVGRKMGLRFRFRPGSLRWGDVHRVKHLVDHVHPVGVARELIDGPDALRAKLSVAPGARGDELLTLAGAQVYDGMSIGVDFSLDPEVGDAVLAADGVYDVLRADLREITTTAMPAFDDARVTSVAASRDNGGTTMHCATCGTNHAPNVACPTPAAPVPAAAPTTPTAQPPAAVPTAPAATFSAEQFAQFAQVAQAFGLVPATPPATPAPAADPGPQVVNPFAAGAAVTLVTDPAPYRFDAGGNLRPGSHDLSRDLFLAKQFGDQAAHDRALTFIRETFDAMAFDVNTGNVSTLNPVRQRPDLFVDQKRYRYPVWEAINKGALQDITGFTFPKFNSAAGLVGPHTEGVEPTSGTYTATNQTVQPTAISGKAKITREVWDQGGNPQVSNLIWQKMVQGWYESLEARAVAVLDAATPTAIPLTAGGGTTGQALVAELVRALSLLQFVRGGYRFTDAFAQVDLFTGLTGARDNDGRPILPSVNPANASGRTNEDFTGVRVGPATFWPAWALAASGSVVASSYLFDRTDVHGWASAPQRLEFNIEVAHVYIGIWGYAAAAISDLTGVREITYDPVP